MTQRKFRDVTTGGYWVLNVEDRETDGTYVLHDMIVNNTNNTPS